MEVLGQKLEAGVNTSTGRTRITIEVVSKPGHTLVKKAEAGLFVKCQRGKDGKAKIIR
jgi:hypothetical protein